MKVVINTCWGGFSLSNKAMRMIYERKGETIYFFKDSALIENPDEARSLFVMTYTSPDAQDGTYVSQYDINRNDPDLIAVVEELGAEANGAYAKLAIVEIPDDVKWYIAEYDGMEHVAEEHRTWG